MDKTRMQAALFERAGEAEQVVQLRSVPIPEPGRGEVLVRLQAASLHPADRMFIAGAYRSKPVFPQRAGLVGAGVIVRSGATVDLSAGTRVAFRHPGAWSEYAVVPAARLFVVPDGADAEAAGQFALNPLTAWGLLETAGVSSGDWLAVNAAASNVALMVRGLAQARGVRVLEVPRFEDGDAEFAQRLLAASGGTPIASRTCERRTLPEEQAEPALTITPARSSAITWVAAVTQGMEMQVVLGRRRTPRP